MRAPRGVGSQAIFLAGATGFAQVLIAVVYLFAARGSDPNALGLAIAAIALGTSAAGLIDFGTNSHWVREIARSTMGREELSKRLVGKLVIAALAGGVWALGTSLLVPRADLWMAAPVMWGILATQTSQVPLRGARRGDLVAVVVIVDRVIAASVFFSLIALGFAAVVVLWVSLAAGSVCGAVLAWFLAAPAHRPKLLMSLKVNPWGGAGYFGLSNLANSTQSLDLPLLTVVSTSVSAGIYGAVNRWTQPMGLLASAFTSASVPFVARSTDIIDAWHHLRKGIWMPLAAVLIAIGVCVGAPWIVQGLLGHTYAGSADVLRVLALASIPSILSQPAVGALQALGRDRYVAWAMLGTVALQLVLVALLGKQLGALGAGLASLAMELVLIVVLAVGIGLEVRRGRLVRSRAAQRSVADVGNSKV